MVELGLTRWSDAEKLRYVNHNSEEKKSMRTRMSRNQMAEWIHHEDKDLDYSQDDLIDEYFDCMIDCNDNYCRKVCTEILR